MKTCFKCHRDLPFSAFYRHPAMADGHLGKCKACTRNDATNHRNNNLDRCRAYDRSRNGEPQRVALFIAKSKRKNKDPQYMSAHNAVTRAVKSGTLVRPSVCSRCPATERIQGHHDDYSKPLEVMWLCPICHAARHKELGRLRTVARLYGEHPVVPDQTSPTGKNSPVNS